MHLDSESPEYFNLRAGTAMNFMVKKNKESGRIIRVRDTLYFLLYKVLQHTIPFLTLGSNI